MSRHLVFSVPLIVSGAANLAAGASLLARRSRFGVAACVIAAFLIPVAFMTPFMLAGLSPGCGLIQIVVVLIPFVVLFRARGAMAELPAQS